MKPGEVAQPLGAGGDSAGAAGRVSPHRMGASTQDLSPLLLPCSPGQGQISLARAVQETLTVQQEAGQC